MSGSDELERGLVFTTLYGWMVWRGYDMEQWMEMEWKWIEERWLHMQSYRAITCYINEAGLLGVKMGITIGMGWVGLGWVGVFGSD